MAPGGAGVAQAKQGTGPPQPQQGSSVTGWGATSKRSSQGGFHSAASPRPWRRALWAPVACAPHPTRLGEGPAWRLTPGWWPGAGEGPIPAGDSGDTGDQKALAVFIQGVHRCVPHRHLLESLFGGRWDVVPAIACDGRLDLGSSREAPNLPSGSGLLCCSQGHWQGNAAGLCPWSPRTTRVRGPSASCPSPAQRPPDAVADSRRRSLMVTDPDRDRKVPGPACSGEPALGMLCQPTALHGLGSGSAPATTHPSVHPSPPWLHCPYIWPPAGTACSPSGQPGGHCGWPCGVPQACPRGPGGQGQ